MKVELIIKACVLGDDSTHATLCGNDDSIWAGTCITSIRKVRDQLRATFQCLPLYVVEDAIQKTDEILLANTTRCRRFDPKTQTCPHRNCRFYHDLKSKRNPPSFELYATTVMTRLREAGYIPSAPWLTDIQVTRWLQVFESMSEKYDSEEEIHALMCPFVGIDTFRKACHQVMAYTPMKSRQCPEFNINTGVCPNEKSCPYWHPCEWEETEYKTYISTMTHLLILSYLESTNQIPTLNFFRVLPLK